MKVRVILSASKLDAAERRVRPPDITRAMREVGERAVDLVREGFRSSRDPYGQTWAPLAATTLDKVVPGTGRRRSTFGTRPLVIRGDLAETFRAVPANQYSVRVGSDSPIATYHQQGSSRLPQRRMLPTTGRPLPAAWRRALVQELDREVRR